ncbi:MAG: WD40 repeat domain-containing protein [Planctomycetales bacterium]
MPKLDPKKIERAWFLPWNAGWTRCVTFLGGSERLAAGNQQGDILLWDLPGKMPEAAPAGAGKAKGDDEFSAPVRRPLRAFRGHTNLVSRLGASPDGKWLYSASWDHTLRIWDTQAPAEGKAEVALFDENRGGQAKKRGMSDADVAPVQVEVVQDSQVLEGHREWIRGFSMSADGGRLLTGDDAGIVILWDMPAGKELTRLETGGGWARAVALSHDAKLAFVSESSDRHAEIAGSIKLWDLESGKVRQDFTDNKAMRAQGNRVMSFYSAAFAPDGKRLALGLSKVHLFDVESGKIVWEEEGHKEGVVHVAFSADGQYLFSTGKDTVVRVRDAKDGKQVAEIGVPRGGQFKDWLHDFALSPDEQWLATADMAGMAHVWHFAS